MLLALTLNGNRMQYALLFGCELLFPSKIVAFALSQPTWKTQPACLER